MIQDGQLFNYIGGRWQRSRATEFLDVRNPATAEPIVRVPLSSRGEVDAAAQRMGRQSLVSGWCQR